MAYEYDLQHTAGQAKIIALYDGQLSRLNAPYQDIYINTSFGKTHLIETGNQGGPPLLVFHGGNATTAYNLLACRFLLDKFHIYAVDTIGHPGKARKQLSRLIIMIMANGGAKSFPVLASRKCAVSAVPLVPVFLQKRCASHLKKLKKRCFMCHPE